MLRSALRPLGRSIASGSRRYASSSSGASSTASRNRALAIGGTTALVFAGYMSQRSPIRSDSRVDKPALEQKSLKNTSINADESKAPPKTLESLQKTSDSDEAKAQKSGTPPSQAVSRPKRKPSEKETSEAKEVIEKKSEEAEETMSGGGPETQGAFNEETGEINWDCPCLGGMADGPCGEEFKAAFSCFVFSEEEPKGINCVDKFKGMQDCFRRHPEIYGEEIDDMDDDEPKTPSDEEVKE